MNKYAWRKSIGKFWAKIDSGSWKCKRCGVHYKWGKPHVTDYSIEDGCFALCEDCWRELNSCERLPFYEMMFGEEEVYDLIKDAVLAGK